MHPRITAELNDGVPDGERVNHKRVARVMRVAGIRGYTKRRRVRTTIPEPSRHKVPDLLNRDFTAPAPNQRYVGDITYVPLAGGTNLYLATVIDCYSRRLAGWAVADHMRTELVEDALNAAAAAPRIARWSWLNPVCTRPPTRPVGPLRCPPLRNHTPCPRSGGSAARSAAVDGC